MIPDCTVERTTKIISDSQMKSHVKRFVFIETNSQPPRFSSRMPKKENVDQQLLEYAPRYAWSLDILGRHCNPHLPQEVRLCLGAPGYLPAVF